jgi:hypothetical protein
VIDDMLKVLSQWWANVKDNEGMLQILGRDPAGNVGDDLLAGNSAE